MRLRQQAIADANAAISALNVELANTEITELRGTIYRLMEAQIKRKILANSRPQATRFVLDRASVPDQDRFDSPKRASFWQCPWFSDFWPPDHAVHAPAFAPVRTQVDRALGARVTVARWDAFFSATAMPPN